MVAGRGGVGLGLEAIIGTMVYYLMDGHVEKLAEEIKKGAASVEGVEAKLWQSMGKPSDILAQLNEMAGYAPDEEIELYEEIKFEPPLMCEHIDKRFTFKSSQLEDGDIVCFQKSLSAEASQQLLHPDVPSFFEYRRNLQVIHFRSLDKLKENEFCLPLSKLDIYDEVVEKVAHQLGVDDPSKIRLTSHNTFHQKPKPQSVMQQIMKRPEYSLQKNYSYQFKKMTEKHGVDFFVKSADFDKNYPIRIGTFRLLIVTSFRVSRHEGT
ncbi:hypothetical protein CASFOL_018263 [Castilleja foliolosa]|uniref:Ubiquitin carboxyl-terminal hydrolase 7 ICP0-binding domain-containing protein n=1 Tax=Castilleja foliolosa TaxID=1961234 RepID=A0ABD3D691_9LAMI